MIDPHTPEEENDNTYLREELLCQLGNQLKSAREHKGLSLGDAAQTLKLRQVYLAALERGDWDDMPGEVYAVGFLKQYAAFLDLDVSNEIAKLKSEEYQLTKPLTFPDPSIAPRKSWVIVAALAFVVLFILFNMFGDDESEQTGSILPPPVEQQTEEPALPVDIAQEAAAPSETGQALVPEEVPEKQHLYRFTATGSDCWIQISLPGENDSATPELLREVLLKPGEVLTIHQTAPYLLITSGNAAALEISIDGHLYAKAGDLGKEAQVIRNHKLEPSEASKAE